MIKMTASQHLKEIAELYKRSGDPRQWAFHNAAKSVKNGSTKYIGPKIQQILDEFEDRQSSGLYEKLSKRVNKKKKQNLEASEFGFGTKNWDKLYYSSRKLIREQADAIKNA